MPDLTPAAEALHPDAERWARMFHDAYELAAPLFGYETREASRKPWADVPENNRALMTAVAGHVGARIIAEARAEQAAEVERLRAALTEAIAEAYCPTTSGGTEGRWCITHDTPMVNEAVCSMVRGWMDALAATPEPRP